MTGVLPDYDRCPCCGRPFRYVHLRDPKEEVHNSTEQVVVPELDPEPLYRRCPYCLARWHRYAEGHPLRAVAEPWVAAWPAHGFRNAYGAWADGIVQVARGTVGGGRVEVRPATEQDEAPGLRDHLLEETVHVLTAWNPYGRSRPLAVNLSHHAQLRDVLRDLGWHTRPAGARAPDWQWAERSIAILGVAESDVAEVARDFGQPAFYRWTNDRLHVMSADGGAEPLHSFDVTAHSVASRICPMRAVKGAPQEAHVCRDPGGPWISASIHESARWNHHRQTFLRALGCDVCNGGPADGPGGRAVPLYAQLVPSRYGPARYQ